MSDVDLYRLPTNVKPTHYDLTFKTDLEKLEYHGVVKVSLDVKTETSSITFNSTGLELWRASIYSDALKAEQPLADPSVDDIQQRVTYQLTDKLPPNSKAQFKIFFSSTLLGDITGYFKSTWVDEGKTKHYALTQFEPTSARRAFPCWDEPLLKATFSVSMISRVNTINLGNMPVVSDHPLTPEPAIEIDESLFAGTQNEKWKVTRFETTPLMSCYIVAFANGEFEHLESSVVMPLSGKAVPLRVYATKDVVSQAQYTLDVKKAVLPLYEKIFDVEYPLPKLDTLVAHDFIGAMENWGLILGSMNYLLIDPKRASIQEKKAVATMESHEIAHMWFGNITTMEWWNYLYLNEGFATLMGEVIIPGAVFPEWHVNTEFTVKHLSNALTLDAKLSSHPIEVDIPDANHVVEIFDSLSYSKAASVLRMLSSYIGEEKFLKGVSFYLKKRLFANSRTHDLWEGISEATGLNITDLMENWITKMGFPVITVTEAEDGKGITVRQDRFLETGPAEDKDNETIWNIPLAILYSQNGKRAVDSGAILQERAKCFSLDTKKPFKINANTNGVYRVLYTPERLVRIAAEAAKEDSIFNLDDRLGLVLDAMALSRAGLAKLSSALTLVELWRNEKEYLVWQGIADNLDNLLSTWWEYPDITENLNTFRRSLFVPLVVKLGYDYPEGEASDQVLLRKLAISQASSAGDEGVNAELEDRFKYYLETGDDSKIPAESQGDIFAAAVKYGGRKEYEAMIKIHDEPKTVQEKNSALRGLSSPQDESLIKETFEFISTKARSPDILQLFRALLKNHKARRPLTNYMQDKYEVLYKRFKDGFLFRILIPVTISFYSSQADLEALETFFKEKDTSAYNQSLTQELDGIRARIGLIKRSTEDLREWFAGR
ncbi:leucyl aminopeptidase [Gymnopilus junonius]|uniref:Aminopeptidase n=1 Tax=Gymnopilus junonius TaxID=109634 RepID=A0A9P5TJ57_GYMJU|nr:leucyl aminopeptidase [Gymnopilus junonius]